MPTLDSAFWRGRRVLVTGAGGFKGSWLTLWLEQLDAEVVALTREDADVRDAQALTGAFAAAEPEVVFHLAAQPIVGRSQVDPVETYAVNVMGTVNLLEAARLTEGVRTVVLVTSQDVYEDHGVEWPYREDDLLGARNPYGAAKACAELVASAMRRSLLAEQGINVATARSGNVVGGGDWGEGRLVPDLMRAALGGRPLRVRNPGAVRPWQHVLEPLHGYLLLAQALDADPTLAMAYNFGPRDAAGCTVRELAQRFSDLWGGELAVLETGNGSAPAEAAGVRLDISRARARLGWEPVWSLERTLEAVVDWYRGFERGEDLRELSLRQLDDYASAVSPRRPSGASPAPGSPQPSS